MKTIIERYGNIAIIRAFGRITIGDGDIQVRDTIANVADTGHQAIILDLSMVTYMDSSGLGELVQVNEALMKSGVRLCLSRVNTKVYDLMSMAQLVTVFAIYDSIEDAIMTVGKAA